MEYIPDSEQPSLETRPRPKENVLRRFGRRVFYSIVPPTVVRPFNPEDYNVASVVPEEPAVTEAPVQTTEAHIAPESTTVTVDAVPPLESSPIVVTLSRDEQSIGFYNNADEQILYPVTPKMSASWIFGRFVKMYAATGGDKGTFSSEEIAALTGYKHTTVVDTARKLGEIMPSEVITYKAQPDRGAIAVSFGDIALASRLQDDYDEVPLTQLDFEKRAAEIDRGKIDLTTYDHALIIVGDEAKYLPLESKDSITAGRVVEALKIANLEKVDSARVAAIAWGRMSVAERQLYVTNANHALASDESRRIENDVLRVLRGLTNKLMLTHEQRSDKFNLLMKPDDFLIRYSEESSEKDAVLKNDTSVRPIIAPGDLPLQRLSNEQKEALINDATQYVQITRAREKMDDETAIAMLDFIMSHEGRWALKEISGTPAGYKQPATALKAMHKYLRRSMRGRGLYYDAYTQRLVRGNRKSRLGSGAQQVGGRLPGTTKWSIGRSMNEVLDFTIRDSKTDD